MARFRTVTVVGVGLIGGSLGMAIRRQRLAREVIGVGRRAAPLRLAERCGAIDWGTQRLRDAVRQSELVVLATPVGAMARLARQMASCVPDGCIVTDIGSVKESVVASLEGALGSRARVVGAHPMAGSELSGVAHARADLFQGAVCLVTRTARTDLMALRAVTALWRRLGSRVRVVSPQRHDRLVASISHLPHLAAVGAALAAERQALPYAAGSFRDVTRVAGSDPELWADIAIANGRWLSRSTDRFARQMRGIARAVATGDRRRLLAWFRRAQRNRAEAVASSGMTERERGAVGL
jgi:prephenate dehydrogenase